MSKKTKVIAYKNLPARLPILPTAVAYLFLDKFDAVEWVWGAVATLFAILWVLAIYAKSTQQSVEVIKQD